MTVTPAEAEAAILRLLEARGPGRNISPTDAAAVFFLLLNDNWTGLVLDGSAYNMLLKRQAWGGEQYQLYLPNTDGFQLGFDEEKSKAAKPAALPARTLAASGTLVTLRCGSLEGTSRAWRPSRASSCWSRPMRR